MYAGGRDGATNGGGEADVEEHMTATRPVGKRPLARVLVLWAAAIAIELLLYRFSENDWVWRDFVRPMLVVVPLIALAFSARMLRPRSGVDRRQGDRRD
jgi:hypothetical protein